MSFAPRFEMSVPFTAGIAANFKAKDEAIQFEVRKATLRNLLNCRDLMYFFAPVKTSFMRNHIRVRMTDQALQGEVGFDVMDFIDAGFAFYPFFVNYGTRNMAARPFMDEAYAEVSPQYLEDINNALRGVFQ